MRLPNQDGGSAIPAEVYDPALKELFISNPDINAVEVYSTVDAHSVGAISVPGPAGLSFVPGDGQLVIGTITPYVYIADPVALHIISQIAVPASVLTTNEGGGENMRVVPYPMADGSIFLGMGTNGQGSNEPATLVVHLVRYVPGTGAFTPEDPGIGEVDGNPVESLNGTSLLVPGLSANGGELFLYTTAAQAYAASSGGLQNTGYELAANSDGSQFAVVQGPTSENVMFLGANLQVEAQYTLPQTGTGVLFSRDGKYLYILLQATLNQGNVVVAIDTQTGAPAGYFQFVWAPGVLGAQLFDVDENYNLFGAAQPGGAWIFNASHLNTAVTSEMPNFPDSGANGDANPGFGPLAGGTQVQLAPAGTGSGSADGITSAMEAYFGATPATADVVGTDSSGSVAENFLTATSPATTVPGPVSVLLTDATNDVTFLPDVFSYGPHLLRVSPNVGSAKGGDVITVAAYGLGYSTVGTQVTIGGAQAQISLVPAYEYTSIYPEQMLSVTVPAGTPGWANISITTPDGSDTLTRGFQYLKQETNVAVTGTFTFAVYDTVRDLFYLTGSGNSVAVFNPATQAFQQPLQSPAGVTSAAVLQGEALTPDTSELLVADPTDQSVVIFNLAASTASTISVVLPSDPVTPPPQPMYVTTAADSRAFVSFSSCIPNPVREINLTNLTVQARPDAASTCPPYVPYPGLGASTADGNTIIFAGNSNEDPPSPEYVWSYTAASDTFTGPVLIADTPWVEGRASVSSDGSVIVVGTGTLDQRLLPLVPLGQGVLNGQLHESGSLLYTATDSPSILVTDTHDGLQLIKIGDLSTGIYGAPAVNTAGDEILANIAGGVAYFQLSVVPLAVGTVSPAQGSAGTSIVVTGSGFVAGTAVTIGGKKAACTLTNGQSLACIVPSLNSGAFPMALANPDGQTDSLEYAFVVQ